MNGVLLDSNCPHQLVGGHDVQAVLLLDPQSLAARQVTEKFLKEASWLELDDAACKQAACPLDPLATKEPSCEAARMAIGQLLALLTPPKPPETKPRDSRIIKLLDYMASLEEKRISLGELCDFIALSESRLVHLFKRETGVPIRRYLLWMRLMDAVGIILGGQDFTMAAHETGFSDSAHLSRTFKKMFGLSPNKILKTASLFKPGFAPCNIFRPAANKNAPEEEKMQNMAQYLRETRLLDFSDSSIQNLVKRQGWDALSEYEKSARCTISSKTGSPSATTRRRPARLQNFKRRVRPVQHQGNLVHGPAAGCGDALPVSRISYQQGPPTRGRPGKDPRPGAGGVDPLLGGSFFRG